MPSYWLLIGGAALIALLTFGIPLLLAEYFPWRSLRDQRIGRPIVTTESYAGRTVLITGANGAFGSRAAKIFARRNVGRLVLVDVRDCGGVKAEIEAELEEKKMPKPEILVWQVDLMSFEGCREVGRKAKALGHLDHVLLTAGILSFDRRESPEGWETCESPSQARFPYSKRYTNFWPSDPSQLPLHSPHRPPSPAAPQVLPVESRPSRSHLRHNVWGLPRFLHHVRPEERLLPQAPK